MTAVPGAFSLESVENYGHREWFTLDPASELKLSMIHGLSSNTPRVGTVCGSLITTTIYSVFVTRRFEANWEQVSSELVKSHPELSEGDNLGILNVNGNTCMSVRRLALRKHIHHAISGPSPAQSATCSSPYSWTLTTEALRRILLLLVTKKFVLVSNWCLHNFSYHYIFRFL